MIKNGMQSLCAHEFNIDWTVNGFYYDPSIQTPGNRPFGNGKKPKPADLFKYACCLEDICKNQYKLDVVIGGALCTSEKLGFTAQPSYHRIHICPLGMINYGNLAEGLLHEIIHACGYKPLGLLEKYIEDNVAKDVAGTNKPIIMYNP